MQYHHPQRPRPERNEEEPPRRSHHHLRPICSGAMIIL